MITLSQGSYVEDETGRAFSKPAYRVDVVDSTGAGDGWAAALEVYVCRIQITNSLMRAFIVPVMNEPSMAGKHP
jgi:fructose-1-phosphate kinase PfkB-like protein